MDEPHGEGSAPPSGPAAAAAVGAPSSLGRNGPFLRLIGATLASTLGDWIGFLAIIALTASILGPTRAAAFAVSGVMVARVLPSLLLGPIAGVFVDRWDRRRVLIVTDAGRALVMALIPFTREVLALLLATLVLELLSALFAPAKDAILPSLVRPAELVRANQANLIVTYGTLPLAGVAYALLVSLAARLAPAGTFLADRPVALPIWVNAASFLVSAALLSTVPVVRTRTGGAVTVDTPGVWAEFREGLRFVAGHPVIRTLIIGVMVAAAAAGVVITTGEFFADILEAGQSGYGFLVAVVGSGLVVGLLIAAPLTARVRAERTFAPAILVAGLALALTAAMPTLGWAIAPAVAMGAGTGVAFVVGYTVLQQRSDDVIRGRTFAAFGSGVRLAIFGSTIAVPLAIGLVGREQRMPTVLETGTIVMRFPYAFGGVRATLLGAGLLAALGAVVTGLGLHRSLEEERTAAAASRLRATDPSDGRATGDPAAAARRVARGVLVVFEGGDGAGKSTQIGRLRDRLLAAGLPVVVTREPGGTPVGERVRDVLLAPGTGDLDDRAEALLYAAARAQHVAQVIAPALETGHVVVSDRFIDSSVVYQGIARGLGEDVVADLNRWATGGLVPDLTVLLDLDADEGLRRLGTAEDHDRLEAAGPVFHRAVADGYRHRAAASPARYLVVDASRSPDEVADEVATAVLALVETTASVPTAATPR